MTTMQDVLLLLAFLFLACLVYIRKRGSLNIKLPLPPGPRRLPIIGNLFDMPVKYPWKTYDKWFKEFRESRIKHSLNYILIDSNITQNPISSMSTLQEVQLLF